MTAGREGPVWLAFRELAHLPPEQRREQLMLRLEHIWNQAQDHTYVNKKGEEFASPDGTLQLKVVQAVAVLQGLTGAVADKDAADAANMTDAQLLREATKRLPPAELEQLADALIEMRQQQRQNASAIVTTGENSNAPESPPDQRPKPGRRSRKRKPAEAEGHVGDSAESDAWV